MNRIKSAFLIIILLLSISAKIDTKAIHKDGQCDQTIIYYISTISANGEKIDMKAQIMVDPIQKLIKLYSKDPNGNEAEFDTVIERMECDFNAEMTKGSALYKGYIKQRNGTTTKAMIKIVADEKGKLSISNADPDEESTMVMLVDKWAIVKD